MAKAIKELLISKLASGTFISGQMLGDELGVSRAAISKQINALAEMGLDVFRVTGKGYKLVSPLELLNKSKIQSQFSENTHEIDVPYIEVHNIIDSTNDYLMRRIPNHIQNGQVCIAEYQSAGRGRRGRQWISPFGSHLYMSIYWSLEQGMTAAMGLSTVVALAVSDAVKALYNIQVELKWPNDIYINGVKLAGILIDLEGSPHESCHVVIGIGLNVNMPNKSGAQVDQPWTDLQQHTPEKIDRNTLVAKIIECLFIRLNEHKNNGLDNVVTEWNAQDYFYNKSVKLITGVNETKGICKGINNQGALLLEINNTLTPIYGGEVSLRGDE